MLTDALSLLRAALAEHDKEGVEIVGDKVRMKVPGAKGEGWVTVDGSVLTAARSAVTSELFTLMQVTVVALYIDEIIQYVRKAQQHKASLTAEDREAVRVLLQEGDESIVDQSLMEQNQLRLPELGALKGERRPRQMQRLKKRRRKAHGNFRDFERSLTDRVSMMLHAAAGATTRRGDEAASGEEHSLRKHTEGFDIVMKEVCKSGIKKNEGPLSESERKKRIFKGREVIPLILVPPRAARTSLINIFNAHALLQEGRFVRPEVARQIGEKQMAQTGQLPHSFETALRRKSASRNTAGVSVKVPSALMPETRIILQVVDDPSKLQESDWARLVAVFASGQLWQFRAYHWKRPAELFAQAKGLHLHWEHDPPHENARAWRLSCLPIARHDALSEQQRVEKVGYKDKAVQRMFLDVLRDAIATHRMKDLFIY